MAQQHRRHRDAHRRPAQPHHRQPGRPVVQRLPRAPRAIVVVLLVVFVGLCWLMWGRRMSYDPAAAETCSSLRAAGRDHRLGACWADPGRAGRRAGGFVTRIRAPRGTFAHRHDRRRCRRARLGVPHPVFLEEVEWETLVFFVGLFVMVGALVHQGIIGASSPLPSRRRSATTTWWRPGHPHRLGRRCPAWSTTSRTLRRWHPWSTTLSGRPAGCHPSSSRCGGRSPWVPTSGGNATAVGASANVVVTGIAKRNGHPSRSGGSRSTALVVATVTVLLCVPYLWLRYFVLA